MPMVVAAKRFWEAHRWAIVAGLIGSWVLSITLLHHTIERAGLGTYKDPTELLQIGALPVT